jgi:hypothetical protein
MISLLHRVRVRDYNGDLQHANEIRYNTEYIKVKWSRYRPDVTQSMGTGIALLFLDRGTRRWWVVSSTPRPHFTPGKDPVPIVQEAGWAPGPVWTGGTSRPHRDLIQDRPARSSVAIPTELPGPRDNIHRQTFVGWLVGMQAGRQISEIDYC